MNKALLAALLAAFTTASFANTENEPAKEEQKTEQAGQDTEAKPAPEAQKEETAQ